MKRQNYFGKFEINTLSSLRNRKKRIVRRPRELTIDDPIQDPIQYFKVSVYFATIDIILQQTREKFSENSISVMKDIGLLSLK